jgi:hypothetical protein
MSTPEKLLSDLRGRSSEPIIQRLMLADVERDYGKGFADTLRKKLDAEIEKRRK